MEKLLPSVLKELWQAVNEGRLTSEQCQIEQERLLDECRDVWSQALILDGDRSLKLSLLRELGAYVGCDDLEEMERRCKLGAKSTEDEWHRFVGSEGERSIERFYDQTQAYLYDLTWWHTLIEDDGPLAYVVALRFAQLYGRTRYMDFGAGIGSGGILFARHGLQIALADISSSLLRYSQWRFDRRGLRGEMIDLKKRQLPEAAFDFVTAMDVWEHLVDPAGAVNQIATTLRTGGFLYGRFALEPDDQRPQHIVRDFEPVFQQLRASGFRQIWQDDSLWGHRVFRKEG